MAADLPRFVRRQRRVVLPLFAAIAVVGAVAVVPADVQLGLLAAAVVTGLPHGALDGRAGRALLTPLGGERWLAPFAAGYGALAAATLLLWLAAPELALVGFLALAAVHFGEGERWSARSAMGAAPFVAAALGQGDALTPLFAALAGPASAARVVALLAGPVALAWLGCLVREGVRGLAPERAVEIAAVAAMFAAAPPLVAFAAYFALLHAPRALVEEAGDDLLGALREAAPFTALALLGGAALWWAQPAGTPGDTAVRTVFQLLSALTVPHMALAIALQGRAAGQGRSNSAERAFLRLQPRR